MKATTIQAVRGMNDILPEEGVWWDHFEHAVTSVLHAYGYRLIRMPLVERTELFVRSIGEVTDIVEKEMYSFVDQLNAERLTLRPEGTASCVRAVLEHNLLYGSPQRLFYMGPMFRHEKPQKGRYRQFHQIGVEAFGFSGPDIDAEQITLCARLWRRLGISDVTLELNTLGDPDARARYRGHLVRYLRSRLDELDDDSRRRLESNPLRILDSKSPGMRAVIDEAPRLLDDLDEPSIAHFEALQKLLREAHVGFSINPRLVRGLDYYNRTVFEWTTTRLGAQGTVCAGGRYDGLVEQLGGKGAPACGFAMGVERLVALMQAEESAIPQSTPHAYVAHHGERASMFAARVAERMRDHELAVVLHCGGGSFKSQMKRADASGARYAVIIGDAEADAGKITLKPLRDAIEQALMDVEEAIDVIHRARA